MPDISALNRSVQLSSAAADFFEVARCRAYGKFNGGAGSALRFAQSRGASPRVREMLEGKTAVPVGSLGGVGGELALVDQAASMAFLSLLPPYSAFDRLVTGDHATTPMPMHSRLGVATSTVIASSVGESFSKPVTRFSVTSETSPAVKAVALVTYSKELVLSRAGLIDDLFGQMLRNGVAQETDRMFLDKITQSTGIASHASTGKTASALLHDLDLAQQSINNIGVGTRLYFIVPLKEFFTMKLLRDGSYILSPDDMIGAIRVIPTAAQSSPGVPITYSVLVDASALGCDAGVAVPEGSSEASLQLDTAPATPPTGVISLWQQNLLASRIERYFGATVLRSDGLCVITGEDVTA